MKKNFRILRTKDYSIPRNYLYKIPIILISLCIISCQKEKKTDEILITKFSWEPGISAPKYYPVAGNIDFGNAGHGSNTSFDNGWGMEYGGVVSGEKYKEIPKEVYIDYYSVADGKDFKGTVKLDQEKILQIFRKYCKKKSDMANLVVGMAPGGWVRVWFNMMTGNDYDNNTRLIHIEIVKFQLKGYANNNVGIGLKTKDFKTWGNTYTYWQHHGIPYEAWANNEKEYDIIFDFDKPNPRNEVTDPQYSSLDGTLYYRTPIDSLLKRKLPADLVAVWKSKNSNVYYDTHVTFPKNFSKIVEELKLKKVIITLKIEDDDQHGILYLTIDNKKEKLLRFKTYPSKDKILGNSDFSKEIEYFIP